MVELLATTRRIDRDLDLLERAGEDGVLFERSRSGLAGRGVAARVGMADADRFLAAVAVDDEVMVPGSGAVAFGAIPFGPGEPCELVVPAELWGRNEDGARWHTTVVPAGEVPAAASGSTRSVRRNPGSGGLAPRESLRRERASGFEVEPSQTAESWCELVERTAKVVAEGELDKVVLARRVIVRADAPIDVAAVLARLRSGYPTCYLFHVDGFVGASPELLVSRAGDVVRSHPMAGTMPRGGDASSDARLAASLLSSEKNRAEHQITIDMVHDTLLPWCSYLDYEAEPSIVPVANVQHLATLVEGRLSSPAPSVLELVRALHPTPAVCGHPRDAALSYILENEGFDRGRYAGAVGWVDSRGNGSWAVSVRCAQIEGNDAVLSAGCGIVADSDASAELEESRAKLLALLGAIVRP